MLVVLEDNKGRNNTIKATTAKHFPDLHVEIYRRAPDIIAELKNIAPKALVFTLDHDLEEGNPGDNLCGTGMDVVNAMIEASRSVEFIAKGVIIHTSNKDAAPRMKYALKDAGFKVKSVAPMDSKSWIGDVWLDKLTKLLKK